jgi:hypothetical protein
MATHPREQRAGSFPRGRHRLGVPGARHCVLIPAVAEALAEYRRGAWFARLLSPARHSFAAVRRRPTPVVAAGWVPAAVG